MELFFFFFRGPKFVCYHKEYGVDHNNLRFEYSSLLDFSQYPPHSVGLFKHY